jgi:moderate conductance mechanosensitive channel
VPLMRVALGVVIGLGAGLIVLADFGVNITPLLAGASILGLAVSFGSQALVKDIVSGIFYLTDDAFRAGEYIECGQTKGIVEGFTLRSIRLRHPSGQLHTIPFGDLGKIANFSRDWAIVRYDFSFPRDADIEKVRHAVDGIDTELQGDPDYRLKILEPLKMQGVVGVTDNTLVVQFRFAAQPGNPEAIQRDVMIRMMRAFKDQGIEFGNATVGG